ncbi:MAG: hypothetical protein M1823_006798, partial [Watsoniomyces obsoletus]
SPLGDPLPGKEDVITENAALDADLAQQSEAWAALYKHCEAGWDGRKAHVVAHDHGGLMALRANLLHGCEYASLCLIDVVAIGPFGQPLFKLVAENQSVFQALPESVFEGILESYIRDAAHKQLPSETMETLKAPWMRPGGKEGFIRQLCQANSRRTDEVEGKDSGEVEEDAESEGGGGADRRAHARLHQRRDDHADRHREESREGEQTDRPPAKAAELPGISELRDPRGDRHQHDRRDQHADRADEQLAQERDIRRRLRFHEREDKAE